jgi:hypothetical protein
VFTSPKEKRTLVGAEEMLEMLSSWVITRCGLRYFLSSMESGSSPLVVVAGRLRYIYLF